MTARQWAVLIAIDVALGLLLVAAVSYILDGVANGFGGPFAGWQPDTLDTTGKVTTDNDAGSSTTAVPIDYNAPPQARVLQ